MEREFLKEGKNVALEIEISKATSLYFRATAVVIFSFL